jgi:predicted DNA-binding transcriptional regulator YafY
LGAFDENDAEEVELRFTPQVAGLILERPWHKTQTVEERADGGVTLRLRSACTPELEGFILRWAGDVKVVSPPPLRGRVQELGTKLVAMNG